MGLLGITATLRIYDGGNFSVMCSNSCLALQKVLILTILPKSPYLDSESVSCSVVSDSLWPRGLCSLSGSSVHRIFQARILEWVAISYSRGSAWPRDWTWVSCTAGGFFTIWGIREALRFPRPPQIQLWGSFHFVLTLFKQTAPVRGPVSSKIVSWWLSSEETTTFQALLDSAQPASRSCGLNG